MLFIPPPRTRPGEIVISTWSLQGLGASLDCFGSYGGSLGGTAPPAANVVFYQPFWVPEPFTITKMGWINGSAAGNLDMGVWDEASNLLVSTGSTAMSGASRPQISDVTDTTLQRGRYYSGLVVDTTTTITLIAGANAAGIYQALGCLEQAGVSLPLASNASPAVFAKYTRAFVPGLWLVGYRVTGP